MNEVAWGLIVGRRRGGFTIRGNFAFRIESLGFAFEDMLRLEKIRCPQEKKNLKKSHVNLYLHLLEFK